MNRQPRTPAFMMPISNQANALKIAACIGAVGGFSSLLLFLFFLFAFPDPQGGIGLVIAPLFSTAVGTLLAAIAWGIISAKRGSNWALILVLPALLFLVVLLWWFVSEIWQLL